MNNTNGEFKGSTKQAIKDMNKDIDELKKEFRSDLTLVKRWLLAITVITAITATDSARELIGVAIAVASGG